MPNPPFLFELQTTSQLTKWTLCFSLSPFHKKDLIIFSKLSKTFFGASIKEHRKIGQEARTDFIRVTYPARFNQPIAQPSTLLWNFSTRGNQSLLLKRKGKRGAPRYLISLSKLPRQKPNCLHILLYSLTNVFIIQMQLLFSFTLPPEAKRKRSRTPLNTLAFSTVSDPMRMVSSINCACVIRLYSEVTSAPSKSPLSTLTSNILPNASATRINRIGERGHPCLMPLPLLKKSCWTSIYQYKEGWVRYTSFYPASLTSTKAKPLHHFKNKGPIQKIIRFGHV